MQVMPGNYQRSYEILWERRKRPSPEYPNNCDMFENGRGDLGPCWECQHCHGEAYEIEAEIDAEQGICSLLNRDFRVRLPTRDLVALSGIVATLEEAGVPSRQVPGQEFSIWISGWQIVFNPPPKRTAE